jgi:hypothetical protein
VGEDRNDEAKHEARHEAKPATSAAPDADDVGVADLLRENLSDRNSLIDSTLPTLAFLAAYLLSGSQLRVALLAAVAAGVVIAVLRLVRRESLRHIVAGFLGVAIAALLANATGRAEDFFLPGLLLNVGYAAAFAVSAVVRRPLVGIGISVMTADGGAWREFAPLRSAAYRATWVWAGLFSLRVLVQLPLYLAGAVGALGTAKLVLGFPLFLLGAFATHRLLSPALALRRESEENSGAGSAEQRGPAEQHHGPHRGAEADETGPHRDPLP